MRFVVAVFVSLGLLAPAASARPLDTPVAHASATCSDYSNRDASAGVTGHLLRVDGYWAAW